MTLIEVLIAMSLFALAMVGLAPAFYSSLGAATTANHRTVANGLAVAATEAIRATPYSDVGFYSDQPTPADCSSQPNPVILGATSPGSGALLVPTTTQTTNAITYTVERCIDWVAADNANNTASPYPNAYKATTVFAHWSDTNGVHTITIRSSIYPGGLGPLGTGSSTTTTSTTVVGAPSPPTNATAVDEQPPTDTSSIYVSWTAPASSTPTVDHYVVQYNTTGVFSGSGTYASSPSVTATNWIAGSLTPGTVYYFQVISVAASGTASTTASNVANAATASSGSTPPPCTIFGLSVTPTQGVVNEQNQLVNATAFSLALNASSGCSNVTVEYTTSGGQPHQAIVSGSEGQMTGTAGTSSSTWDPGTDAFTVYVNGVAYSPTVQQLVNICVENGNSGKC